MTSWVEYRLSVKFPVLLALTGALGACATIGTGSYADESTNFSEYRSFDFSVAYTVGTRDKIRMESYPTGYRGHWGWHDPHSHYYFRKVSADNYTQGTLGVDIFDNETGKPVWHGWAEKTVTQSDRADAGPTIEEGIAKLFESFPR